MVRIHPDPPIRDQVSGIRNQRGCSSVGRAPALQAGGRRFDPVQLHHYRLRGLRTVFNAGDWRQWPALNAVRSLTIGKARAHSGLDESTGCARVELYLALRRETKGARRSGANTLVAVGSLATGSTVMGSSDEVHVMDALAITGDEGRGNLRKAPGSW